MNRVRIVLASLALAAVGFYWLGSTLVWSSVGPGERPSLHGEGVKPRPVAQGAGFRVAGIEVLPGWRLVRDPLGRWAPPKVSAARRTADGRGVVIQLERDGEVIAGFFCLAESRGEAPLRCNASAEPGTDYPFEGVYDTITVSAMP